MSSHARTDKAQDAVSRFSSGGGIAVCGRDEIGHTGQIFIWQDLQNTGSEIVVTEQA